MLSYSESINKGAYLTNAVTCAHVTSCSMASGLHANELIMSVSYHISQLKFDKGVMTEPDISKVINLS